MSAVGAAALPSPLRHPPALPSPCPGNDARNVGAGAQIGCSRAIHCACAQHLQSGHCTVIVLYHYTLHIHGIHCNILSTLMSTYTGTLQYQRGPVLCSPVRCVGAPEAD